MAGEDALSVAVAELRNSFTVVEQMVPLTRVSTATCRIWLYGFCLISLFLLSGCRSTLGLLVPIDQHPHLMAEARQAALYGNEEKLDRELRDLDRAIPESSRLLYLLESGRLKGLAGDIETSVTRFDEAGAYFDEDRIRATFRVTESLQGALSIVTNDRALPYQGHLYEALMVYYFQAMNHLKSGDLTKARVEMNKALRDLRWGNENLPAMRRASDKALSSAGVRAGDYPPGFGRSGIDSSVENPLIYYLSALLFEAVGDAGRAEIDYRNALAYAPDSKAIRTAIESLRADDGMARIVFIQETDWVSSKVPFSLPVFIENNSYTLSFPYYPDIGPSAGFFHNSLRLGDLRTELYPILNLNAVARKALEEEFAAILMRQALRLYAKQEIQDEAREVDPWLGFAASIFSVLSDHPDLRSWLSLPALVQVGEQRIDPGQYNFSLPDGRNGAETLTLEAGDMLIIRIVAIQGKLIEVDSFKIPTYTTKS